MQQVTDDEYDMRRLREGLLLVIIDFDGRADRRANACQEIPTDLADRVFVLGAWTTPEALKRALLGSYTEIGLTLAKECREGSYTRWQHELLRHNAIEITRMRPLVRPILFGN